MQPRTTHTPQSPVPSLPCPNCAENILATGFYNYCIESVGLREDNRTDVIEGRIYMNHDESGHETTDHECDVAAYCAACNKLLPWPLYAIRALDGCAISNAQQEIDNLLAQLKDQPDAELNGRPRNDLSKGEAHADA
jgi:hypothetical protein